MEVNCFCLRFSSRPIDTNHFLLEIRWLPIEDVHGLHAVVDHPQSAIEEAHEVTTTGKARSESTASSVRHSAIRATQHHSPRRLSALAHELLTVVLPDCNQELVQAHGSIDGHFAPKEGLDVVLLDGVGCHILDQ